MWVTLELAGRNARYQQLVKATCSCGNVRVTTEDNIKRGRSVSCGCIKVRHGHAVDGTLTGTYVSWAALKQRCNNPKSTAYPDYGGRGISVHPEWLQFGPFLRDMGIRPEGCSIDRIDVDGNYEPSNCRWATASEQASNQRRHKRDV